MSDDNLAVHKEVDGFTHESPIRAFTDFQVSGSVAIGKGFRPSLQHLATYLDAMERKERWRFVQVVTVDGRDPTILFHRDIYDAIMPELVDVVMRNHPDGRMALAIGEDEISLMQKRDPTFKHPELKTTCDRVRWIAAKLNMFPDQAWKDFRLYFIESKTDGAHKTLADKLTFLWPSADKEYLDRLVEDSLTVDYSLTPPPLAEPTADDPVNPKHYSGTACADIGELLTANAYQTLKYNWRLGKKDDPCVEIDKSLWYIDREIALAAAGFRPTAELPDHHFFDERLKDQDEYVIRVARGLISWCRHQNPESLRVLRRDIQNKRNRIECGSGLAV